MDLRKYKLLKIFALFLLLPVLPGCKQNVQAPMDVFPPIQIGRKKTPLILSDYNLGKNQQIDSFKIFGPFSLEQKNDTFWIYSDAENQMPLGVLRLFSNRKKIDLILKKRPFVHHIISLPDKHYKSVKIKGEFNGWNASKTPFQKNGLQWQCHLYLKEGNYQYKLIIDGKEQNDPTNPRSIDNGMGGENSLLTAHLAKNPKVNLDFYFSPPSKFIFRDVKQILVLKDNHLVMDKKCDAQEETIDLESISFSKHEHQLRIYAANNQGQLLEKVIPLDQGKMIRSPKNLSSDDWHKRVMYFVFVDRFYDGDKQNNQSLKDTSVLPKANFKGGDLKGITTKIEEGYFKELGVNTLWISPITENPKGAWGQFKDPKTKFSGYHGYWPVKSTKIDERFGTEAEMKILIEVAHKHGIKIILDYVANHVHQEHKIYQKHKDWFTPLYLPDGTMNTEKWDEYRLTTWFDTFMPSLDLSKQWVTNYMVDSALFWVTEYDFDGFRHDATKHIPLVFWRTLSKEIKKVARRKGKKIYQIGETYGDYDLVSSYLGPGLLDAQFDFNLYDKALPFFSGHEQSSEYLLEALKESIRSFGPYHLMGNITGNQDKPRFISYADGSLPMTLPWNEYKTIGWKQDIPLKDSSALKSLEMFMAFNFTIPGIPIIYYGDEIGMPGAGDPDNRRMMSFENLGPKQEALKSQIGKLATLRKNSMALLYGDLQMIHLDKTEKGQFAFQRKYLDETVFVGFNKSNKEMSVVVNKRKITIPPNAYKIYEYHE